MKLRPYQQIIVNKVINTVESVLIQIPTGGGKTLIAESIVKQLVNKYNKKILFVAPKIILMKQTENVFKSLNPHIIHKNNIYDKNKSIFISTIQTAFRRDDINPDVIIIDEIHYGYDGKMIEKLIKNKSNLRVIGLSATPYDRNGNLLKGFKNIINEYDMNYMIQNKYLVPIRSFILVRPDLSNVKMNKADYDLKSLSIEVSKNKIILEIVKASKSYIDKSKKVIVFAVDINHAELLKKSFEKENYSVKCLHSNLSKEDIDIEIDKFKKNETKILVSVLMLTTGFDVPDTDLAIIARPTKSQNLYKQMVGRITRLSKNKDYGILLDCGNVIENLGKPLDPIIEKIILEKNYIKIKCKICDSEEIKLLKINGLLYLKCKKCEYEEQLEKKTKYKCEFCKKSYGYEGNFELINNRLYLNCKCGYETLISEFRGNEKFIEMDSSSKLIKIENQTYLNEKNTLLLQIINLIKEFKLNYSFENELYDSKIKEEFNFLNLLLLISREKKIYSEIRNLFTKEFNLECKFNNKRILEEIMKALFILYEGKLDEKFNFLKEKNSFLLDFNFSKLIFNTSNSCNDFLIVLKNINKYLSHNNSINENIKFYYMYQEKKITKTLLKDLINKIESIEELIFIFKNDIKKSI